MSDERLRLIAEMRDRLSPQLRRLKAVMESTGRVQAFRRLAAEMGVAERAGYRLGFMLGRTVRYGAIAAAGGAVVAGAAFVKFGRQSADALDDQAAFAKQINFSADSLRTLEGVAKRYNVSQEGLRGGLQKFTTQFGRLKQGQGGFYTYLKKTNPALAEQFRHVATSEQAFVLLSDAIAKTSDPAKRAALAKAAGVGQEFLRFFADGPEDLRKTIKEVIRFQGRLGPKAFRDAADYGDAMDNIGLAWQGLRDELTASALPVVTPLLSDLADFMADNREGIASGFREIAADAGTGLRALGAWAATLKKDDIAAFWDEMKQGGSAVAEVAGSVRDLAVAIKDLGGWKAVIGAIVAYKMVGGVPGLFNMTRGVPPGPAGPGSSSGGGLAGFLGMLGPFAPMLALGGAAFLGSLWATKDIPRNVQIDPATGLPWNAPPGYLPPGSNQSIEDRATRAGADAAGRAEAALSVSDLKKRADDLDGLAKRMDAELKQWVAAGQDKSDPTGFAEFTRRRFDIAQQLVAVQRRIARILASEADKIGTKIGETAAGAMLQRMMFAFGGSRSGGGSGGARLWNASYQPSGGGLSGPRANGVGQSFSGMGMLDLIAAAEGTGKNYNETLGYGRFTGGKVNLTGMTLDQIDALQSRMLRHPGNSFNSSALGRYQFTRTRLRNLRKRYGISGSALFDSNLQDQLGKLSLAERGGTMRSLRNEWEGLRRVPDSALKDAMQRHRRKKREERQKVEGSASVDIRFPNGVPAGTRVGSKVAGLFKAVNLDTGRSMKEAMA